MNVLPSTSSSRDPQARRMNSGDAPTALNARTGLSTPPGRIFEARANSDREREIRIVCLPGLDEAAAADHDSGPLPRVPAVGEHDAAVDDARVDAGGVLKWVGEGGAVRDRCRVEDHQVGGETRCD